MRVALLVPRLHFQAPFVLRELVHRARAGLDRYLVMTTPKLPPGRSPRWKQVLSLLRTSGPDYLASMAAARAVHSLRGAIERLRGVPAGERRSMSVAEAARLLGADRIPLRSVRELQARERLIAFRPDLLCAVFFNQVVPEDLLRLAPLGAINVHPSFLPSYRGISPCFWVLARGEAWTGVTIHGMTWELDRGPVLAQARLEVSAGDTVDSLYRRCASLGGRLLAGLLARPERLRWGAAPPQGEGSYCSAITAQAVREFRARGRKFF